LIINTRDAGALSAGGGEDIDSREEWLKLAEMMREEMVAIESVT
jgi:hypothetical protein